MSDDKSSQDEKEQKERKVSFSRNDEKWWIFGMFYCNPSDPLIFVRGRGKGLVLNWGHKAVLIGYGVLAAAIVALIVPVTVL